MREARADPERWGRRAKVYTLTAEGKRQLAAEAPMSWSRRIGRRIDALAVEMEMRVALEAEEIAKRSA